LGGTTSFNVVYTETPLPIILQLIGFVITLFEFCIEHWR